MNVDCMTAWGDVPSRLAGLFKPAAIDGAFTIVFWTYELLISMRATATIVVVSFVCLMHVAKTATIENDHYGTIFKVSLVRRSVWQLHDSFSMFYTIGVLAFVFEAFILILVLSVAMPDVCPRHKNCSAVHCLSVKAVVISVLLWVLLLP